MSKENAIKHLEDALGYLGEYRCPEAISDHAPLVEHIKAAIDELKRPPKIYKPLFRLDDEFPETE